MQHSARNPSLSLLLLSSDERPRIGLSHRGNEVGETGERGKAGEWSLYVVASDDERPEEGIVS